ncbi:MAG: hypothetical protein IPH97_03570 [Ignavibacteriales bacterium]|nr:hypothetical protein [Ignavibacteriales bacterium]
MNKNIHFIMLEVLEPINDVDDYKYYPCVQIIYPSNKNQYLNIEEIKNRVGSSLRLEEKEEYPFTITLNVDLVYSIPFSNK